MLDTDAVSPAALAALFNQCFTPNQSPVADFAGRLRLSGRRVAPARNQGAQGAGGCRAVRSEYGGINVLDPMACAPSATELIAPRGFAGDLVGLRYLSRAAGCRHYSAAWSFCDRFSR